VRKKLELKGRRFGRLLVLAEAARTHKSIQWQCLCDCGNYVVTFASDLNTGRTKSCGCLQKERASESNRTHQRSKTKLYRIWRAMIERCSNSNNKRFSAYGGRGITVCDRWAHFENFLADMGEVPEGSSLDRIDNDGPYSPENCRWASVTRQARNKRSTIWLEFEGRRQSLPDWANEVGLKRSTLSQRIFKLGWSVQRALTTPKV
jgi:hypothetical protein